MMKYLFASLFAAGISLSAVAQGIDFASVDADQSGTITLQELQVVAPDITEETFAAVDTDGSGDLSTEEFAAISGG